MPGLELIRFATKHLESLLGIDEVRVVAVAPSEVLPPKPKPGFTRKHSRTVAEPGGICGHTKIAGVIENGTRELAVVRPGAAVDVVGSDSHPNIVDDAHLCVDVDRNPTEVLQVVAGDSRTTGAKKRLDGVATRDPTRGPGHRAVAVGVARNHHDDVQARMRT